MKLQAIGWTAMLGTALFAGEAWLSPRYQTVYVLGMNNGLDQHLTSRLTSSHTLWVVLEPASADTVLTDALDDTFWNWLAKTYSPAGGTATDPPPNPNRGFLTARDVLSSGRYKGTVFLVDPRKKVVLWSIYALPRNSAPPELDRTAARVADELKKAFGKK
jgi:hypothetical protein